MYISFLEEKGDKGIKIFKYTISIRDYHTKWSKPDRERQILYDITYMWNLKKKK